MKKKIDDERNLCCKSQDRTSICIFFTPEINYIKLHNFLV